MTPRTTFWIAFSVGLAGFAALAWHFTFTCDDAYITFRYAKNLAEGRGLVFNYTEAPPVEGYSNFLWTVWLSLGYAAGATGDALATVANVSTIACAVALLALVVRLAQRRLALDYVGAAFTALFLGSAGPFAVWATGGLETMPFALALFAVYERLLGDRKRPRALQAGLCAVAAGLLRADGFLWVGVVLDLALVTWFLDRDRRDLLRATLITLAMLAVAVGAHFLWRHSYYGEWMPNTARVKAGFTLSRLERGFNYVATFALTVPAFIVLPIAALGLRGRPAPALAFQSIGVVLFAVVYALYVGGDFMPMGRFLVPAVPFVALLFAVVFVHPTPVRRALGGAVILVSVLLTTDVLQWPQGVLNSVHFRWNSAEARSEYTQWSLQHFQSRKWRLIGLALTDRVEPGESIIRGPIGAVGYFTDLFVHDLNGLVDLEVATRDAPPAHASPGHDKNVSPRFFFRRRPTYMGASLVFKDSPLDADLSPDVLRLVEAGAVDIERHDLPPGDGLPPGIELRIFRFRWR
jgi:hypothetical protein